jgi:polyhydroxybutyrate depolymerase
LVQDCTMTIRALLSIMILACLAISPGTAFADCPKSGSCTIASGRYVAVTPPQWDGKTPLPTLVFLHGYNEAPEAYLGDDWWFKGWAAANGLLIVLPEGKEKTWSYVGSPMENRDDTGFIASVLDDVESRYPVDREKLWLSGFSQGGSMVWSVACNLKDRFKAFAPVAGAFWEPLPQACPAGPIHLRHVHGTADTVVPMQGRPIGERWRQGDVMKSMAILAGTNQCQGRLVEEMPPNPELMCSQQTACRSERSLMLCTHDGGHRVKQIFMATAWAWVQGLPLSR